MSEYRPLNIENWIALNICELDVDFCKKRKEGVKKVVLQRSLFAIETVSIDDGANI